jgi:hypothetical protein
MCWLSQARIRIRSDVNCRSRIRIENNADPKHYQSYSFWPLLGDTSINRNKKVFFTEEETLILPIPAAQPRSRGH